MEYITVRLGDSDAFDEVIRRPGALRECGDLTLITKDVATVSGKPGVRITFTVVMPDGTHQPVQCTTTYNALEMAMAALRGRYGPGGFLDMRRESGAH